MKPQEAVLAVCLALTPARLRRIREEQWKADLLDGPGMGISPATLLFGAACSSAASRFYDLKHRGGMILSHITKGGENMKLVIGALGTAVVLAGAVAVSVQLTPQRRRMTPFHSRDRWQTDPLAAMKDGGTHRTWTEPLQARRRPWP